MGGHGGGGEMERRHGWVGHLRTVLLDPCTLVASYALTSHCITVFIPHLFFPFPLDCVIVYLLDCCIVTRLVVGLFLRGYIWDTHTRYTFVTLPHIYWIHTHSHSHTHIGYIWLVLLAFI